MTTLKKTVLDPKTIPTVAIDFMNNTHFEEIAMVRNLGELVTAYQESKKQASDQAIKITQSLDAWLEHTHAHFSRENELMVKYQFPAYDIHLSEHKAALDRMEAIVNTWKSNKNAELVSDYIFQLWPNWFNSHVNSMDMITAQFAMMNGFNDE